MRTAMRRSVVLAVLVPILTACSRDGDLAGDVFIVTRGGLNIKLGLVRVTAIPADVVQSHLDSKKQEAEREIAKLEPEVQRLQGAYNAARSEANQLDALWTRDLSNSDKMSAAAEANKKASSIQKDQDALKERAALFHSSDRYFAGMPSGIASAKTDADGKFSMKIPRKGKFALAARASREVPTNETYYWLVFVSLDGQASKHVMLSNDNMVGAGSADSLLK